MVTESVESLTNKARQAIAQGNHEQARQLYLQALNLKADSPDVHYGLATVCFLMNDLPSAAFHFKEVTRMDPLRAGAHINLGAVYNRLDQIDEAIESLRRGIGLDPHRAEGYYNLGLAYRQKKQVDLAIQAYHEATRLNARMPDAHLNLANAYLEKGQYGMAVVHYEKALDLRPNWQKALHGLAQARAAVEASRPPLVAEPNPSTQSSPETAKAQAPAAVLDPERTIDPNIHGGLLGTLHKATIESENHARSFLQILETVVEPAIKELSTSLLQTDSAVGEMDERIKKFEAALQSIRSAQRSLQTGLDHVRIVGDRLLKS